MDRIQSLRTRRGPGGEPRAKGQPKPGTRPTPPGRTLSKARDTRKSRVDDRIKKRMSMRYADISGPTDAVGVPAVPALPAGLSRQPTVSGTQMEDGDAEVDMMSPRLENTGAMEMKMLDSKQFDPDAFLKLKLANSTESELKQLQSSLRDTKDGVAADLQKNVFKNYAEFVHISKEIGTLENEMLELKESLSEWKSMPSLLHIDDSASAADRRRNVRSSIADLRILYASQMQALHAQIEGSAKFVPTTPGRHVVAELESGLLALNAATYKAAHPVRFVLLDDAVLVARPRQRRNADGVARAASVAKASGKWVAERCWPLSEMVVLDTKDTPNMTNVFKIRHGKETHVYRAEAAGDKKSLLSQFRHIAEELAAKKRKEREGEHERRKSIWMTGDRSSLVDKSAPSFPDWMADLAQQAGVTGTGDAKDKMERDARWVGDFTDELTVAIALRNFDRAAELVEEGEMKLSTIPSLSAKLTPLTSLLTSSLLAALATPTNRKATVVRLISLLNRLHAGPAARSTFLASRADVIRRRIRTIPFDGDVPAYVHDLAIVTFTGVKHSADWFLASFKENDVASGFVEWAKQQVAAYADLFRKQVYVSDADPKMVEQALSISKYQSKKLLEDYGLDFRFLFEELLAQSPTEKARPLPTRTRTHSMALQPAPTRTPASTPRQRSPASTPRTRSPATSIGSTDRARTAAPPLPLSTTPSSATSFSTPSPGPGPGSSGLPRPYALAAPSGIPTRTRSPAPRVTSPGVAAPTPVRAAYGSMGPPGSAGAAGELSGGMASPRMRPNRQATSSPAPPPRSRDRPGSSAGAGAGDKGAGSRPAPVAVPRRQGMF